MTDVVTEELHVDCPTGAGDMLLAGLIDLGVPLEVIERPVVSSVSRVATGLMLSKRAAVACGDGASSSGPGADRRRGRPKSAVRLRTQS